jgi:predicted RNase H-like HicB family nuclease
MGKAYENRYWEIEEFEGMIVGKLHFTQHYDDEIIVAFQQDSEDETCYWYVSDFLKVEQDFIFADSTDEAMEELESKIMEHIEDEICSLERVRDKFNEEKI